MLTNIQTYTLHLIILKNAESQIMYTILRNNEIIPNHGKH